MQQCVSDATHQSFDSTIVDYVCCLNSLTSYKETTVCTSYIIIKWIGISTYSSCVNNCKICNQLAIIIIQSQKQAMTTVAQKGHSISHFFEVVFLQTWLSHFCKPTFCTFAYLLTISEQNHTHCHHWVPQYKLLCQQKITFPQERILRGPSTNYMAQGRLASLGYTWVRK